MNKKILASILVGAYLVGFIGWFLPVGKNGQTLGSQVQNDLFEFGQGIRVSSQVFGAYQAPVVHGLVDTTCTPIVYTLPFAATSTQRVDCAIPNLPSASQFTTQGILQS